MVCFEVGELDCERPSPSQRKSFHFEHRETWRPMNPTVRKFFDLPRLNLSKSPAPLVLVNGLAEQTESWFANRSYWSKSFDVKVPELLVYNGDSLHERIESGGEVTVDYLTDRLAHFLDEYVQRPPYNFVGSSLGGQILLNYAVREPNKVNRLVLICPSGFHGDENLPMMEGVRRSQYDTLVRSVFHRGQFASTELIHNIERKFQDRRWKKGVLRTLRGTVGHSVTHLLDQVSQPTLIIWGDQDQILSDVPGSIRAAQKIRRVRQVVIPGCGHAPQIEKSKFVNQIVVRYLNDQLKSIPSSLDPSRSVFLSQAKPVLPLVP